jgi:hypothetical protein
MLASYLTDIEQLLDEQRWDAALNEACDLPRIAVALSDPQLRCSGEEVGQWCEQWIRPRADQADVQGEAERTGLRIRERASGVGSGPEFVPTRALVRPCPPVHGCSPATSPISSNCSMSSAGMQH